MTARGRVVAARYRIEDRAGEGAMSVVYRATDLRLGRQVALKLLRQHLVLEPGSAARFRQEARAAASLSHPNVVSIYDWGIEGVVQYLVMEFIDGPSLDRLLQREGRIAPGEAARIAAGAAAGLQAAHDKGIVHRDVKPGNILIDRSGRVRVVDFGIARVVGATAMTRTGNVLGSVPYLSPEQALGQDVTAASDIYSLGTVLFEMLTGERPFEASTVAAAALRRVHEPPPVPSSIAPGVPPEIDAIVTKAMAIEPAARFASARDFETALERWRREAAPASDAVRGPLPGESRMEHDQGVAPDSTPTESIPTVDDRASGAAGNAAADGAAAAGTAAAGPATAGVAEALSSRVSSNGVPPDAEESAASGGVAAEPAGAGSAAATASSDRVSSSQSASSAAPVPAPVAASAAPAGPIAPPRGVARTARAANPRTANRAPSVAAPGATVTRRPIAARRNDDRRNALLGILLALLAVAAVVAVVALLPPGQPAPSHQAVGGVTATPPTTPTSPATASPSPTAHPTAAPTPAPTPAPTAAATKPPAGPPAPAASPSAVVADFYSLVSQHRFGEAAALWSPSMQANYPPAQNIDQRFADTTGITLRQDQVVSQHGNQATVAVDLVEYRDVSPTVREFAGTWQLVRVNGRWLMNQPSF